MFKLLKNNRYIERGLISDCLWLSSVLLTKVNSIIYLPYLENHPLVKYYGLTDYEEPKKLNNLKFFSQAQKCKELLQ